jgi:hypothetical protein
MKVQRILFWPIMILWTLIWADSPHLSKKRQKVVKNKPKRNNFCFYFCTNNCTPTKNVSIKENLCHADSESVFSSSVSSGEAAEYAFPVVEEDDEVEKLDQETKWSCPAANHSSI